MSHEKDLNQERADQEKSRESFEKKLKSFDLRKKEEDYWREQGRLPGEWHDPYHADM